MNNSIIPVFAGNISGETTQLVNARELHAFLESKQQYSNWVQNQIEIFDFTQGIDFLVINNFIYDETAIGGKRKTKDYHITLDMAKELSMVERNAKGKQARLYFIECEKQARSQPAAIKPKTALELAKEQVLLLEQIEQANIKIEHQEKVIEQKDKFICASNEASVKAGEILVREFVKSVDTIDLGEKQFYHWMREQGLIFQGRNEPYQQYINAGYFTWKPSDKEINGKIRYQLRITPRGKVWLSARYMAWYDAQAQQCLPNVTIPIKKRNGLVSMKGGAK